MYLMIQINKGDKANWNIACCWYNKGAGESFVLLGIKTYCGVLFDFRTFINYSYSLEFSSNA